MSTSDTVELRWGGWANEWSWERHMQAACRDLTPDEAEALWARYGGAEGARKYRELHPQAN